MSKNYPWNRISAAESAGHQKFIFRYNRPYVIFFDTIAKGKFHARRCDVLTPEQSERIS